MVTQEHESLLSGTERSQGRVALRNNVAAASALADAVRSTLGPKGLDKMLVSGEGGVTVTNDNSVVSVMVEGRPRPIRKYNIGRVVEGMDEWTINNGILDMTLII